MTRLMTAAAVVAVMAGHAAAQETVESVLKHVRDASGWAQFCAHAQGVQLSGTAELAGTQGQYLLTCNALGCYAQNITGPISVTNAFDGEHAWVSDLGGERRILELGDREQALLASAILTSTWLRPESPVKLTIDSEHSTDAIQALAFVLTGTELAGTLEIDKTTWLPRKWEYTIAATTHTYTSDGTVECSGIKFPASITRKSSNGMGLTIKVERAADAPTFIRSPYEAVLGACTDVKFDAGFAAAIEVKRAPTGHLLVHPRVGGQDLGWFIFDTGAGSNCLDKRAAEKLGVEQFGQIPAVGVGGAKMSTLARPDTLSLGPVTLDKPLMVVMDFAFLDAFMGEQISGLIGYGMLHRVIAEIDMQAPAISLHDPAAYDGSKVTWSKLAIDARVACVEGEFEGHKGWFHLDTGAGGSTVQLHAPAVERLKLLDDRTTMPTAQGGVGGMAKARQGVLKYFEIAGRRTEQVPATFATEAKGAFATPYTLGNIGGGLVWPFKLVMDYQHNKIAFVERAP